MPRQAEWLQQVPAALEALEQIATPVIDRAMLEKLLRVHRRAAIRLMHRFDGYQSGRTFLIERPTLLGHLRRIVTGDSYFLEVGRRERLDAELQRTRRDLVARKVMIATPDLAQRTLDGLPSTIHLAPGKLEIACSDAQDLLRQLLELAQAIANDFEKFEARLLEGG